MALPRIAITTGALRIPPTYFVVQHAAMLSDRFRFEVFARVADVADDPLGIPVHDATRLGGSFTRRSMASLAFGHRHERMIRAYEPQLVHQHFGTWAEPAIHAARRRGAPLVTTVHGYDVFATLDARSSHPQKLPIRARRGRAVRARSTLAAFAASSRVLAVSRFLADRAIVAGAAPRTLAVHYQGIDTDFFTPDARPTGELPSIVFVGGLSAIKGPMDALQASLSLWATTPHRLVFIGTGDLEPALRELASGARHVEFLGRLTRTSIREQLRSARALVLPTQEHAGRREAAGLVLLEAQACGTPVIAYASGGAPEMIDDGRSGLVVPERDIAALADAMRSLIELDDAAFARMSTAARTFVVAERSLTASAGELEAHYRDLLG